MSSIHKAGIAVAGLVTALAVAGAFFFQGYLAAQQAQVQPDIAIPAATDTPSPTATPSPSPQIVYIAPLTTPVPVVKQAGNITPKTPSVVRPAQPTAQPTAQPPTPGPATPRATRPPRWTPEPGDD